MGGTLYPLAMIATFGTRVGPALGRLVNSNKGLLPKLLVRLRTGKAVVGDTLAEVITWAKSNPGNAVMLASTLASLGYAVSDWFGDSNDADVNTFKNDLNIVAQKAKDMIDGIGGKSELASFGSDSEDRLVKDEVSIEVLSWARGFFGSIPAAVAAHRMMQAFVEMPLNEVQHGFSIYKLR